MAGRRHKHRDLWVALAVMLPTLGLGSALVIWQAESSRPRVGFWPHAGEITGIALAVIGAVLAAAIVRGWRLPGGFDDDPQPGPHQERTEPVPGRKDRLLPGERLSAGESLYSPDGLVACHGRARYRRR